MLVLWKILMALLQISASQLLLKQLVVSNAGGLQELQYLLSLFNTHEVAV